MKIYIAEEIPSINKGEEAILRGISDSLKRTGAKVDISVFSYHMEIDKRNYGHDFRVVDGVSYIPPYELKGIKKTLFAIWSVFLHFLFAFLWVVGGKMSFLVFRSGCWKEYMESQIFLISHDGVFSILSLPFILFAKILGKKCVAYGTGFSPPKHSGYKSLLRSILRKLDLVVVREKRTYDYFLKLCSDNDKVSDKVWYKPDPAFAMEPSPETDIKFVIRKYGIDEFKTPFIGIVPTIAPLRISLWSFETIHTMEEKYKAAVEFYQRCISEIRRMTDGVVIIIPHAEARERLSDDRSFASEIGSLDPNLIVITEELQARELKSLIAGLDFLISNRLHAVISAASVCVPFLMMTVRQDIRAHDIIENTINRPDLIFHINDPNIDDFITLFRDKWNERQKIKAHLTQRYNWIVGECEDAARRLTKLVEDFYYQR